MADMMDTLKGILGDDAEDKIKSVMGSIGSGEDNSGIDYISQVKNIMDSGKNDPRSRLLMSLKPFMRTSRQRTIDSAIRLISLTQISELIKK